MQPNENHPLLINEPLFSDGTRAPIDYINQPAENDDYLFERDQLGRDIIPDTLFVIVWDDSTITTANNRAISNMYDMADCDYMDGVKSVHAIDENGELVKVGIGPTVRNIRDEESPMVYGYAPIMAGKRRVGTVHLTDH